MPSAGPADVHVVRWNTGSDGRHDGHGHGDYDHGDYDDDDQDQLVPASPRHATARPTRWQRTITTGQQALLGASEVIAAQVDLVAEQMLAALERRDAERRTNRAHAQLPEPLWQASEVEVSFGVQLTGEVGLAVFSGSSESSAQITLTFTRNDQNSTQQTLTHSRQIRRP